MRAATAYFIGAGTIIAAIAIGLGGGLVAGNIMNPITPKKGADAAKVERHTEATAATNAASANVQYLTGSQVFGAVVAPAAQAEAPTATASTEPSPSPSPSPLAPASASQAPQQAEMQAAPPAKPAERQASADAAASPNVAASPNNAYAKARDADVKRATSERRRAERRQRWAERRHYDTRDPREMRDHPDWNDVARNAREDSEARAFDSGPRRAFPESRGFPQIRLFDSDDD